tara:strand:- start:2 stop:196 length:195 start_codon:yes stop_codon:yes gene_type:complete
MEPKIIGKKDKMNKRTKNLLEIVGTLTLTELVYYTSAHKHAYEPVINLIKLGFVDPISRIIGYN